METTLLNSAYAAQVLVQPVIKKTDTGLRTGRIIQFASQYIDVDSFKTLILEDQEDNLIGYTGFEAFENVLDLRKINSHMDINKYFLDVNNTLFKDGVFIGCVETSEERKSRLIGENLKLISYPAYFGDFILNRVFPKITPWTKKLYLSLTRAKNRAVSLTEILGRLVYCGFEIVDYKKIDHLTYFVVRKEGMPGSDKKPFFGPIFRMKRIGKDGRIIHVYKLRTMHPYAEYLQEFVYRQNNLQEGGKFRNDFRIASWGRVLRKLWLDELPMIINFILGDVKLVGVRPLSAHFFGLYRPGLKSQRLKFKPGLIPPFYADMPKTLEEIQNSEEKYLESYEKNPFLTDLKYFFRAMYNILVRHAHSA